MTAPLDTSTLSTNPIFAMAERAEALRASGVDVITLAAGEPEAATAEHVVAAAVAAARTASTHHYGTAAGHPALRALIAAKAADTHRIDINTNDVQVTVGTKHALHLALRAVTRPGDEVLTVRPGWPGHRECIESVDAHAVMVDTDDRFLIDTAALQAARTNHTRSLILANPANPTGAVHAPDRLASIAQWCLDNDVWLICDEIYDVFIYAGAAVPALAVAPQAASRIIVVNGVSKVHAMTGWRVGWLFGPNEIVSSAREQLGRTITHVPQLTQIAALAALGDDATPARAVDTYRRNRDMLVHHLNGIPGIDCPLPGGGMFAFPDVSGLLNREHWSDTADLADWLLTHAHVAVVAGHAFGSEHHLRLNFTLSPDRLNEAAHRLVSALT